MKWNFCVLFYPKILKSMILWFVIFEFGLRTSAHEFFLPLRSWLIQVKNVRHSARRQICKLYSWRHKMCKTQPRSQGLSYLPLLVVGRKTLLPIMASERNNWRSRKIFVYNGGPVLASCKTPLTRKALSCLYFRKTKSEEHTVCDLFEYTSPSAKRRMRPCYVPSEL